MRVLKCAIILCMTIGLAGCEYLLPPANEPLAYRPATRSREAFSPVSSTPHCVPEVMTAKRQMDQILKKLTAVHAVWDNGILMLRDLPTGKLEQIDPWGHPYHFRPIRPAPDASGTMMAGFILISIGPDGRLGTGDDIRREGDLLPLE